MNNIPIEIHEATIKDLKKQIEELKQIIKSRTEYSEESNLQKIYASLAVK